MVRAMVCAGCPSLVIKATNDIFVIMITNLFRIRDLETMMPEQCRTAGVGLPKWAESWINIKRPFSAAGYGKGTGMMGMLKAMKIQHTGPATIRESTTPLYTYGLYSNGLHSNGLYSHGLYSHGPYSYGLYSDGLNRYGIQASTIRGSTTAAILRRSSRD